MLTSTSRSASPVVTHVTDVAAASVAASPLASPGQSESSQPSTSRRPASSILLEWASRGRESKSMSASALLQGSRATSAMTDEQRALMSAATSDATYKYIHMDGRRGCVKQVLFSLQSGLANEVSWGFSALLALSYDSRPGAELLLEKMPGLLDIVIGHIAFIFPSTGFSLRSDFSDVFDASATDSTTEVFVDETSRSSAFGSNKTSKRQHSVFPGPGRSLHFFHDSSVSGHRFQSVSTAPGAANAAASTFTVDMFDEEKCPDDETGGLSSLWAPAHQSEVEHALNQARRERLLEVSTILRNLSFNPANANIIRSHPMAFATILWFLRAPPADLGWPRDICTTTPMRSNAVETIANFCTELSLSVCTLCPPFVLLDFWTSCLFSSDRLRVNSALTALTFLCDEPGNARLLCQMGPGAILQITHCLLAVCDVRLILPALELLYQLTQLGDASLCERVLDALQTLGLSSLVGLLSYDIINNVGSEQLLFRGTSFDDSVRKEILERGNVLRDYVRRDMNQPYDRAHCDQTFKLTLKMAAQGRKVYDAPMRWVRRDPLGQDHWQCLGCCIIFDRADHVGNHIKSRRCSGQPYVLVDQVLRAMAPNAIRGLDWGAKKLPVLQRSEKGPSNSALTTTSNNSSSVTTDMNSMKRPADASVSAPSKHAKMGMIARRISNQTRTYPPESPHSTAGKDTVKTDDEAVDSFMIKPSTPVQPFLSYKERLCGGYIQPHPLEQSVSAAAAFVIRNLIRELPSHRHLFRPFQSEFGVLALSHHPVGPVFSSILLLLDTNTDDPGSPKKAL